MTTRRATCSCGQLSATCRGEPARVSMCHCLACQRRTGSVVGVQARWPSTDVTFEGEDATWERVGDEGSRITFHFCPTCGATLWWQIEGMEDRVAVAVGAFADPSFPAPTFSVYEARQHAWLTIPDEGVEHWE